MFSPADRRCFLLAFWLTLLLLLTLCGIAAADARMASLGFAQSPPVLHFSPSPPALQLFGRSLLPQLPALPPPERYAHLLPALPRLLLQLSAMLRAL